MRGIELSGLTIKHGKTTILKNVDMNISPHEFILLKGASGSGKSTLLKAIAGFSPLNYTGTIRVGGKDLTSASMIEKAKMIGMMFQNPTKQFTMKTLRREIVFVLENIQTPPKEILSRLNRAVMLANTFDLLDRELVTLSGGEKQQASLTVLLAMESPFLLLDEPFASVDRKTRQTMIRKLYELKQQGKTIVICDHDMSDYAKVIDTVIQVEKNTLTQVSSDDLFMKHEPPVLSSDESSTIEILNLQQVSYKQNKQILLDQDSFAFYKGITTLTGDNGAGKSTLFRAIAQCHPYKGTMQLNQRKIKSRRKLYQQLSLVTQDAEKQFICLTAQDELTFNKNRIDKRCQEAIDYLGLAPLLNRSIYHLSEGQKKSVQLLTMLSLNIPLLLLDEPFSGLDDRAAKFFANWVYEASQFQDFLIISHRLESLHHLSHHHVQLKDRRLFYHTNDVKEGSHDENSRKFDIRTQCVSASFNH